MTTPARRPTLKLLTFLWGASAVVWLALEGNMAVDVLLAASGLALVGAWGAVRWGGRVVSPGRAVAVGALAGLVLGAVLAPVVLGLMAFKTGLHAHGPEYSAAQIAWVWRQIPLWAGAGALAGAGVALLALGLFRR
jgi:hypothetical protein